MQASLRRKSSTELLRIAIDRDLRILTGKLFHSLGAALSYPAYQYNPVLLILKLLILVYKALNSRAPS